jgi:hypothetical protein
LLFQTFGLFLQGPSSLGRFGLRLFGAGRIIHASRGADGLRMIQYIFNFCYGVGDFGFVRPDKFR